MSNVTTLSQGTPIIGRLAVIGLGLIGGSFAKGMRESGLCREVIGCDLDPVARRQAVPLGVVDSTTADLAEAVRGADLIMLAVPVLGMRAVLAQLAAMDLGQAVMTDVGSTKGAVALAVEEVFGRVPANFVPGHPIAGSEKSGVEAARADLFRHHKVILTPLEQTAKQAVALVQSCWQALGADVEQMSLADHDEVLAATSHLPHLLAYTLVDTLARMAERTEIFAYAAGGFADFTRIASSSPSLWADIVTANHDAVLPVLDRYIGDLAAVRAAIADDDRDTLAATFLRAKTARDGFAMRRS